MEERKQKYRANGKNEKKRKYAVRVTGNARARRAFIRGFISSVPVVCASSVASEGKSLLAQPRFGPLTVRCPYANDGFARNVLDRFQIPRTPPRKQYIYSCVMPRRSLRHRAIDFTYSCFARPGVIQSGPGTEVRFGPVRPKG